MYYRIKRTKLSVYLGPLSTVDLKVHQKHPHQTDLKSLVFSPPPNPFLWSFDTAICGWLEGQKTGGHDEICRCTHSIGIL